MLRNNGKAYPRARPDGGGEKTPAAPRRSAPCSVLRNRNYRSRGKHAAVAGRRKDKRHRLATVQEPGRGRKVGRGERDCAAAGARRRAYRRRLHAEDGARRETTTTSAVRKL